MNVTGVNCAERVQVQSFPCQTLLMGEDILEDEEDKGLGPSLPSTMASSQTSLPVCALTIEYRQGRSLPLQLNALVRIVAPVHAGIKHGSHSGYS